MPSTVTALEHAASSLTSLLEALDVARDEEFKVTVFDMITALNAKKFDVQAQVEQMRSVVQVQSDLVTSTAKSHGFQTTRVAWSDGVKDLSDARLLSTPAMFGECPVDTHIVVPDEASYGYYIEESPHLMSARHSTLTQLGQIKVPARGGSVKMLDQVLADTFNLNMDVGQLVLEKTAAVVLCAPHGNADIYLRQSVLGTSETVTLLFMHGGNIGIACNSNKVGVCSPDEFCRLLDGDDRVVMHAMKFHADQSGQRKDTSFIDMCDATWVTAVTLTLRQAHHVSAPVFRGLGAAAADVSTTQITSLNGSEVCTWLRGKTVEAVHVKRLHCLVLDGEKADSATLTSTVATECTMLKKTVDTTKADEPHAKKQKW